MNSVHFKCVVAKPIVFCLKTTVHALREYTTRRWTSAMRRSSSSHAGQHASNGSFGSSDERGLHDVPQSPAIAGPVENFPSTNFQIRLNLVRDLQRRLESCSELDCISHRDNVLRGVPTRGVKIPSIRVQVTDWANERVRILDPSADINLAEPASSEAVFDLSPHEAKLLALDLMTCNPILDDKLAGMIFLSERLFVRDFYSLSDLSTFLILFDDGHFDNFYVVDNFADKVLSRFLHQGRSDAANILSTWFESSCVWRARAALLAFVPFAKDSIFRSQISNGCVALLQREEEEAKTTTGTLLRAVSKPDAELIDDDGMAFVCSFLNNDALLACFSRAALTKATHHMERRFKAQFRRRCTQLQSQAPWVSFLERNFVQGDDSIALKLLQIINFWLFMNYPLFGMRVDGNAHT